MYDPVMKEGVLWISDLFKGDEGTIKYLSNEGKILWHSHQDKIKGFVFQAVGKDLDNVVCSSKLEYVSDTEAFFIVGRKPELKVKVEVGVITTPGFKLPLIHKKAGWKVDLPKFVEMYIK